MTIVVEVHRDQDSKAHNGTITAALNNTNTDDTVLFNQNTCNIENKN